MSINGKRHAHSWQFKSAFGGSLEALDTNIVPATH
jgi:hypothetical protein